MFPIDELLAQVAERLDHASLDHANRQVTPVPTERIVRWYRTRGLLDPPSAYRGRTALYRSRHVAQVVAIKALQAQGRSLDQIAIELAGLDDPSLAEMSGVAITTIAAPDPYSRRTPFWVAQPASTARLPRPLNDARLGTPTLRTAVELAGGFTLVLPPNTDLSAGLVDALDAVAELLNTTLTTAADARTNTLSNRSQS